MHSTVAFRPNVHIMSPRHLKCSLNLVFISRQSVQNYPV
jgi:hypothetical protein